MVGGQTDELSYYKYHEMAPKLKWNKSQIVQKTKGEKDKPIIGATCAVKVCLSIHLFLMIHPPSQKSIYIDNVDGDASEEIKHLIAHYYQVTYLRAHTSHGVGLLNVLL